MTRAVDIVVTLDGGVQWTAAVVHGAPCLAAALIIALRRLPPGYRYHARRATEPLSPPLPVFHYWRERDCMLRDAVRPEESR